MSHGAYFADIHLHSTLKSFNSGRPSSRDIWQDVAHIIGKSNPAKFVSRNSPDVAKYSQSNFYELAKGRVRAATVSLYPIEKGFLELRNLSKAVTNKIARDEMLEVITGYEMDSIKYVRSHFGYFEELEEEYRYVIDNQGISPDKQFAYKVVNNYRELSNTIADDAVTLGIILSIEGAHVLFNEKMMSGKLTKAEIKKEMTENIGRIKAWEVPPLSMNLCHHFFNDLCGHSKSFSGFLGRVMLKQDRGMESGLTGLGIKALKELQSENNGKRILIDTKHMSLAGRKEYYNWVRSYNYLSKCDRIPIICSHTGVNGYKTMSGSLQKPDNQQKLTNHHFNRWSINVSDEEIGIIHKSGGLIGLMLDKNKLGGGKFFGSIKGIRETEALCDAYSRLFMDNALQVVRAVGDKSGWDSVCIGSDYDGAISHIDFYGKASTMPLMYTNLVEFLERTGYEKQLWYGYSAEDIVDKIMRRNVMDFYERFFV